MFLILNYNFSFSYTGNQLTFVYWCCNCWPCYHHLWVAGVFYLLFSWNFLYRKSWHVPKKRKFNFFILDLDTLYFLLSFCIRYKAVSSWYDSKVKGVRGTLCNIIIKGRCFGAPMWFGCALHYSFSPSPQQLSWGGKTKVFCCFCSVAKLCPTLCDPVGCSLPGSPVLHCLPEFAKIPVHRVGVLTNFLILCWPLFHLLSIFPSDRLFSNESALCIRWPKYWSFSFNISPSNEYSGLISFRMDWLDLLAVQETLKSLPQQPNSKASFLWFSDFFMVQLSHLYKTTGKTITLMFVG